MNTRNPLLLLDSSLQDCSLFNFYCMTSVSICTRVFFYSLYDDDENDKENVFVLEFLQFKFLQSVEEVNNYLNLKNQNHYFIIIILYICHDLRTISLHRKNFSVLFLFHLTRRFNVVSTFCRCLTVETALCGG